jgi:ABC-type Fe3+/spermidine/putrescine transport system ATPase subunit
MSAAAVELRSLAKRRGGRVVLRDLSLEVVPGEWLALLGPTGSGKSTLLRLMAGLEKPDAGEALLDGRPAASVPARDRGVGMVFQGLALWPYLTVEEHLRECARGDAGELMERFELNGLARRRPHELSGGEQQRLALARALAAKPRLLLLDEPFTGLDPILRRNLSDLIGNVHRELDLTTVYVSHFLETPVLRAGRVALLRDGRILQAGPLSELRAMPADDWVSAFLSDEQDAAI